ncbi:baseplate multidomain protein megatron [Devosia sp. CN2-171]|uniref:baseplate multidomain protein megatron n=1 Tax=Devosia sp. CN2-171 TaxID=3400909 RepID=UPI003BF80E90
MATLALSVAGQFIGGAIGGPIGATVGRALGALAGSVVDQALFGEKPAATTGADIRISGSSEGGAVPRLYGWSRLGGNIIWATELERLKSEDSGAKGTTAAEDEEIVASFAIGLCEGEVSRLGRIWADGQLLETAGLNIRFYRGTETQVADSLIEAVQSEAPAYRGLCYLVFERLPLTEFGNRIPNITVELCRVVGELEPLIRSVTVIPGATEFGYDPVARVRVVGRGSAERENAHASALVSDWTLSLDELQDLCPNLEHVALVVSWFGDDLRAGECTVRPKVEAASRSVKGAEWGVAGLTRDEAEVVSTHGDGPAFGGTPSDAAVLAAIADLKARGLEVTLYPMLLMDVPVGNPMGQPAYPWRGRIAPVSDVAAEVAAFVGGAGDWGYRRLVRHYAALAEEAGADALVIGSEMVGMTTARAAGGFPFVAALVTLAAEAKGLAPAVDLTYAADWSEYHGFQPADAPGDKLFHLDPLWASPDIAAVGIDNYMPIADWRDGEDGPDVGADGPYSLPYLEAGIDGGEGFDWHYASDADRLAGTRTPISDGAHGEHWVWRFKDIAGWWGNAHHDRVGGVRSTVPTAWVPGGKPIWLTELGCGAVDKGANQPNVFPDGKSSEDGRPYFSSGAPDGLMQRQFLRAHLSHWKGDPMVGRISLWSWDARPYPAFPSDAENWADAVNHPAGHWLTGRLGALAPDELARAVAADFDLDLGVADVAGTLVQGVAIEGVVSWRDATGSALAAAGLSVRDGIEGLELVRPDVVPAVTVARDELVKDDGPLTSRRRPDPSEMVARLAVGFVDRERDYLAGTVTAMRPEGAAVAGENTGLVLDAAAARGVAEQLLRAAGTGRDTLEFVLPPSLAALEVGDVVAVEAEGEGPFEITEIRDGLARKVTARAVPPVLKAAVLSDRPARVAAGPAPVAEPVVIVAHLPPDPATPERSQLLLAAYASPWPGEVDVQLEATGARLVRLARPAAIGELATPLTVGTVHVRDRRSVEIELSGGHLAPVDFEAALAGANRIAVETDAGEWEVIGFAGSELVSPGRYRLTELLRGLGGSDVAMGPAATGNRLVVLDGNVALLPVEADWLGGELTLRAFAGRLDGTGAAVAATLSLGPVLPLPPVHLRAVREAGGDIALGWVRRSRADAGAWAMAEVPLEHVPEGYRVTIFDGGDAVRTIEVAAPVATYTAAAQLADFGALPAAFDFTVAQLSPVFGAGHAGAATFNA